MSDSRNVFVIPRGFHEFRPDAMKFDLNERNQQSDSQILSVELNSFMAVSTSWVMMVWVAWAAWLMADLMAVRSSLEGWPSTWSIWVSPLVGLPMPMRMRGNAMCREWFR